MFPALCAPRAGTILRQHAELIILWRERTFHWGASCNSIGGNGGHQSGKSRIAPCGRRDSLQPTCLRVTERRLFSNSVIISSCAALSTSFTGRQLCKPSLLLDQSGRRLRSARGDSIIVLCAERRDRLFHIDLAQLLAPNAIQLRTCGLLRGHPFPPGRNLFRRPILQCVAHIPIVSCSCAFSMQKSM